jgi:hypothetical protein
MNAKVVSAQKVVFKSKLSYAVENSMISAELIARVIRRQSYC